LKLDLYKALARTKLDALKIESFVQNAMMWDKIYAKFKVEKETYDAACTKHGLEQAEVVCPILGNTACEVTKVSNGQIVNESNSSVDLSRDS